MVRQTTPLSNSQEELEITDMNELEFAIACIENVARRLAVSGTVVYDALALRSDLLQRYVISNYDVLHTQDMGYVVDDILDTASRRGVDFYEDNTASLQSGDYESWGDMSR